MQNSWITYPVEKSLPGVSPMHHPQVPTHNDHRHGMGECGGEKRDGCEVRGADSGRGKDAVNQTTVPKLLLHIKMPYITQFQLTSSIENSCPTLGPRRKTKKNSPGNTSNTHRKHSKTHPKKLPEIRKNTPAAAGAAVFIITVIGWSGL